MKTIDLTVLVYGNYCHTSRAYLTYLKSNGYLPVKILQLMDTGASRVGKATRALVGSKLAAKLKGWIEFRSRKDDNNLINLCSRLQSEFDVQYDLFGDFHFESYAEHFEQYFVKSFYDPDLIQKLASEKNKTFLYTNGGKVGKEMLRIPGVRFIHIHPGIVPYVRGSDGLLWSILTRNKPGASCFYMNRGIDTGKLIHRKEFELGSARENLDSNDYSKMCLALNLAYDPHLRASTLIDVINMYSKNGNMDNLNETEQDENNARTYFKMNHRLRTIAVQKFVNGSME